MRKQQGIILLITLLLLSILSLLVLSQMQQLLLQHKAMHKLVDKQRTLENLEQQANRLLTDNPACLIKQDNPEAAIRSLAGKQACSVQYDNKKYYYLIEDLGLFPCLPIQGHTSQHWRITLATAGDRPACLQLRLARMAKGLSCQPGEAMRPIPAGIQSWIYLPGQ